MIQATRRRGAIAFGIALVALAAGGPAAAQTFASAPAAEVPRVADVRDLGRAPAAMPVRLTLTLGYRHANELDSLLERFNDPASPLFSRHLLPAQFRDYFSPTPAAYERTIRLLGQLGLTVTQTYANRTVIDATAPAAVIEQVFATQIHRAAQRGYGVRYANTRPAVLPAALSGLVYGVTGLDNLQAVRVDHVRARRLPVAPDAALGSPLRGPDGGYGPLAFARGYDFPVEHGFDGTGHTAGIVIGGDPSDRDLGRFLAAFKIARSGKTTRVPLDGGPGQDLPDREEATLDYETIAGLAPGADIVIYEPNQLPFNFIIDAYNRAVSDAKVETLNSSFGLCESAQSAFARQANHIAKQAQAIGIVFHASTGDSGSTAPGCSGTAVQAPASGPSFVAVGGTSLSVDRHGNYFAETAWFGSGGGVSVLFPRPSYQKGVKNVVPSGRNLPDLSFDADPSTGESFVFDGSFQGPIGGTSLASPIFGALVVEIDQLRNHSRNGFDGAAYAAFAANGYVSGGKRFWHDVTLNGNGAFSAMPGYDQVTGIGSASGTNLAGLLP